uniref:Uncharacterized protein n=1 Tax=Populus trichocarpa TaxID=3694 RepID=A0A2K2AJF5_POPTR
MVELNGGSHFWHQNLKPSRAQAIGYHSTKASVLLPLLFHDGIHAHELNRCRRPLCKWLVLRCCGLD